MHFSLSPGHTSERIVCENKLQVGPIQALHNAMGRGIYRDIQISGDQCYEHVWSNFISITSG